MGVSVQILNETVWGATKRHEEARKGPEKFFVNFCALSWPQRLGAFPEKARRLRKLDLLDCAGYVGELC